MRAFLTGGTGFVGGYLHAHLESSGDSVVVLDDRLDLGDPAAVDALDAALAAAAPDVIYHLAALTHVGRSWEDPTATMRVNVLGTLAVLEAARRLGVAAKARDVRGEVGRHEPRRLEAARCASKGDVDLVGRGLRRRRGRANF